LKTAIGAWLSMNTSTHSCSFATSNLYHGSIYVLLKDEPILLQLDPPTTRAFPLQSWDAVLASNLVECSQRLRPLPELVIYFPAEFLIAGVRFIVRDEALVADRLRECVRLLFECDLWFLLAAKSTAPVGAVA